MNQQYGQLSVALRDNVTTKLRGTVWTDHRIGAHVAVVKEATRTPFHRVSFINSVAWPKLPKAL